MAVSSTILAQDANRILFEVFATADADTDVILTHSFGVAPAVSLAWRCPTCRLSLWVVTAINAATVTVNKLAVLGTGSPNPALLVELTMPPNRTR